MRLLHEKCSCVVSTPSTLSLGSVMQENMGRQKKQTFLNTLYVLKYLRSHALTD